MHAQSVASNMGACLPVAEVGKLVAIRCDGVSVLTIAICGSAETRSESAQCVRVRDGIGEEAGGEKRRSVLPNMRR